MADGVRDLDDEVPVAAQIEPHPEMIADEQDFLDPGLELVRKTTPAGEGHAFRPDRKGSRLAKPERSDRNRLDRSARRLGDAGSAADGRDLTAQNVVVADESGDELPFRFLVKSLRIRRCGR